MRDAADQRVPMTDSHTLPADPLTAEAIPDEIAIEATKQATVEVQTFADFFAGPPGAFRGDRPNPSGRPVRR